MILNPSRRRLILRRLSLDIPRHSIDTAHRVNQVRARRMNTQPVGLSAQLAPKQVMRARLGAADLAIWRSASGVVSAWENRCPHRGMRLSHGFVRGESLACAYHGWHYDCSGQCHKIPAHPELEPPGTVRINSYSVKEQSGIVWVCTKEDASPVKLPDNLKAVRSLAVNCDLEAAVAAFSTVSHSAESTTTTAITTATSTAIQATTSPASKTISQSPRILSFDTPDRVDGIWIAFQQQDCQSVVCHILADSSMRAKELISVSRWCEAARRRAEAKQARLTPDRIAPNE